MCDIKIGQIIPTDLRIVKTTRLPLKRSFSSAVHSNNRSVFSFFKELTTNGHEFTRMLIALHTSRIHYSYSCPLSGLLISFVKCPFVVNFFLLNSLTSAVKAASPSSAVIEGPLDRSAIYHRSMTFVAVDSFPWAAASLFTSCSARSTSKGLGSGPSSSIRFSRQIRATTSASRPMP